RGRAVQAGAPGHTSQPCSNLAGLLCFRREAGRAAPTAWTRRSRVSATAPAGPADRTCERSETPLRRAAGVAPPPSRTRHEMVLPLGCAPDRRTLPQAAPPTPRRQAVRPAGGSSRARHPPATGLHAPLRQPGRDRRTDRAGQRIGDGEHVLVALVRHAVRGLEVAAGIRVDLLDEVTVVHVENVRERGCRSNARSRARAFALPCSSSAATAPE